MHVERPWKRIWALKPLIEAHRDEGQTLHRLPDPVARAFVEANVYRLLLPVEYGGENLDPVTYGDFIEEVASYDGSAGWNFSIGSRYAAHLRRSLPVQVAHHCRHARCLCGSFNYAIGSCDRSRRRLSPERPPRLGELSSSGRLGCYDGRRL